MAILMSNIGLAPSQLPGSTPKEQKMYVGASNGRRQGGPDLFDLTTLNVQESSFGTHDNYQIIVDSHGDHMRSLPRRVGSGSEIEVFQLFNIIKTPDSIYTRRPHTIRFDRTIVKLITFFVLLVFA